MKGFKGIVAGLVIVFGIIIALYFVIQIIPPSYPPIRALWVTRFDYTTKEDVQAIVKNVAKEGFTDLFFQIRGNGTVFYPSKLEPWAQELSGGKIGDLGKNPGWNPLQTAIDAAKPYHLRIHAYMNVLPGWRGTEEPAKKQKQLWTAHPDWFMVDSMGKKMLPTKGWYSFVNPLIPEVRSHLQGIVAELCTYDVAGIHLDYIRYPEDYRLVAKERYPKASKNEILRHSDFSYDPLSVGLMKQKYGNKITRENIVQFRCDSVTRLLKDLSYTMQQTRTNCVLSASVFGDPTKGREQAYQDSGTWIRKQYLDWAIQMNYATRSFNQNLKKIKRAGGWRGFARSVVVGIYCKNDTKTLIEQIQHVKKAHCRGIALFSYSYLFDLKTHQKTKKGKIILQHLKHF